jgi:P27 family predicted phage terminase small subunit
MAGRKSIPTKLKLLTGNPGGRPIRPEPEPMPGIPERPGWLEETPGAIEEWNKLTEILDGMGILTIADGQVVAQCVYIGIELGMLAREIRVEGRVCYTQKVDSLGNEIMEAHANPKATQQKNLMTEFRQILGLLGLTPVDRARLSVTDKGRKSKFGELVGAQKQAK